MKLFHGFSVVIIALFLAISLLSPTSAFAAIDLGTAGTFGILSSTFTTNGGVTAITGDVGYTTLDGSGTITVTGGATSTPSPSQAGIDQGVALSALNALPCNFSFSSAQDLSLLPQPLAPGVYCTLGAQSVGTGGITLNGAGTYVFRSTGALNTVVGSTVSLTGGASECNVFWTPLATTLGANSTFVGTVIDTAAITVGSTVTWLGRALAYGLTVTTDTDIITAPSSCTASPEPATNATLKVIKQVVNTYAGTATSSDFSVHVKLGASEVSGSPLAGATTPGTSYSLVAGTYTISETASSTYVATFSGDCDSSGNITLASGDDKTCTITNVDIAPPVVVAPVVSSGSRSGGYTIVPPLIDVTKVPNPLALPAGPGFVSYTYTLRNIGLVPVTKITMVGDSCSPISLISGDTNKDSILGLDETWVYSCATTLSKTHTNTVVATGWANGLSTTDIASATVVVGSSNLPPLIHVTKIPSTLATRVGGLVTYVERVTNLSRVPLSNIRLVDDKCSPTKYVSGDTNRDSKLDVNESWIYTCQARLNKTTTNIAVATGEANGISVRDIAIVTVAVVPGLPNTGYAPKGFSATLNGNKIGFFTRSLDLGLTGDDVSDLQTALEQKGFLTMPQGVAKGYYGNLTRKAVMKYQEMLGLPLVGTFGPLTRAKLNLELGQ